MATYTIGEAAVRSGFPASTLRYYEGIGLVEPSDRTEAGYQVHDERALARLLFVARAKQLSCSLEEITHLVAAWDGERCAPVQHRLRDLVSEKIADVQHKTVEMVAFGAQPQAAAAQLATQPIDGPCGEGCACVGEVVVEPTPVVLGRQNDSDRLHARGRPPGDAGARRGVAGRARSRSSTAGHRRRIASGVRR